MASDRPNKRARLTPETPTSGSLGTSHITRIPDELLLKTLANVDTRSLLSFRRTCRRLEPSANSAISKRFKRLYIKPSLQSIHAAISICNHVFGENVEDVVLIGQNQWNDIQQACSRYRTRPIDSRAMDCTKYPQWKNGFLSWPGSVGNDNLIQCTDSRRYSGFAYDYTPLISALAKLPKLRTLGFATGAVTPGLNRRHKGFNQIQPSNFVGPSGNAGASSARLADAEVFCGLLFDHRLTFTTTYINMELPFTDGVMAKYLWVPRPLSTPFTGNIKHLSLIVDCCWYAPAQCEFNHRLLSRFCNTIEDLWISFVPHPQVQHLGLNASLNHILGKGLKFPRLKRFAMILQGSDDIPLHHYGPSARPPRPYAQMFDLPQFIRRHASTLSRVTFRNVLFGIIEENRQESVSQVFVDTLTALEHCPRLKSAEYLVNRYKHHPLCKMGDHQTMANCTRYACGDYSMVDNVGDFEIIAFDAGVELNLTRWWNFGEKIMRDRVYRSTD